MKVIYGAYQPDSGTISKDGRTVSYASPSEALEAGIGMVFQEQSLIPNLSVMENIFLGDESQFERFGLISWKAMAEAAQKQLRGRDKGEWLRFFNGKRRSNRMQAV